MEALFHLIFELVKIFILSCVYARLVLSVFELIATFKPGSWIDRVSKKKIRFLFLSGSIIYISLFIFMFTYWGNHGFGDSAKIPIGYGIVVKNINWDGYGCLEGLETSDNFSIQMTKFLVVDNKLIGNLDSWFYSYQNAYFVYEMKPKKIREFGTQGEFDEYALANNLPTSEKLLTFEQNYRNRWSGWRFWLLP